MTTAVKAAEAAVGKHVARPPFRLALDAPLVGLGGVERALYLAMTAAGELHYVGKVDRRQGGSVAGRLSEHLRSSRRKRRAWRWLWVIPISPTMERQGAHGRRATLISQFRPPGNCQHAKTP